MMSQGLAPLPSAILGYTGDQITQNPDSNHSPTTQPTASSSALKRKRNLPDPDSEVIALSPNSLMATNKFLCEVCNKGFQRDQNLQLHRRGHNLPWKLKQRSNKEIVKKKVYICPEKSCVHHDPSRALGDLTGIKKHFSRKHGEKKWKCDKCPKKYAVKSDWKAHSKICGTREHKCDCGTLFSRKDSFITHRAFCTAVVDQSGARFAQSAGGINNPLSLRNDHYLSGTFFNPQMIDQTTNQFLSGSGGGFYPELSSTFNPYGHVNNVDGSTSKSATHNSQWLEQHPQLINNASARFLMGNPTNLSNDLFLQHAGQTSLYGSSSSSQAPWLNKCQDQSAFGNASMSSYDQLIGNSTSGNGVMQVKREDDMLSNNEDQLVDNLTSSCLYNNPTSMNNQQQAISTNQSAAADQLFLSSLFGRNSNNNCSIGHMNYGLSNGQVFTNNNGFNDQSFSNSPFSRPNNNRENLNHLFLLHEAAEEAAAASVDKHEITNKQHEKSSQTRDFLGVGGNEISREQFQQAAAGAPSDQFNSNSSSAAELDNNMSHANQQWKR